MAFSINHLEFLQFLLPTFIAKFVSSGMRSNRIKDTSNQFTDRINSRVSFRVNVQSLDFTRRSSCYMLT